jgi:CheY-like chemotaxis protein
MRATTILNWPFPNRRVDGLDRPFDTQLFDFAPDAQAWEAPASWHEKPRLLVAVSNDAVSAVCDQFFTEQGFAVETAWSGVRCLELLQTWSPHALILELELPWGGGDGVMSCLRADARGAKVPVLLLLNETATACPASRLSPYVATIHSPHCLQKFLDVLRDEIPEIVTMLANDSDD